MWASVHRILKPYQRLNVVDLGPIASEWTTEDGRKAIVLAWRFFPFGPVTPNFQMRSVQRRREVEDWLPEEWEDIPPITSMRYNRNFLRWEPWQPQALMGSWPTVSRCRSLWLSPSCVVFSSRCYALDFTLPLGRLLAFSQSQNQGPALTWIDGTD